jgi:L-lactate dehydrogenase complex protein LldG
VSGEPLDARDEMLRRVRYALGPGMSAAIVPRDYERSLPASTDLVELFVDRVDDYRATVHRTTSSEVGATVASLLAELGLRRMVAPAGIPQAWLASASVERVADEPPLSHAELDAVDGVITGCAIAIAETGTIVLDGGPDQGRRAISLLPDVHVCVVAASQVVGSVPEALERLDPQRPQTWISGPSATSDIELQRVEGVHGPRNLHVVVLDEVVVEPVPVPA